MDILSPDVLIPDVFVSPAVMFPDFWSGSKNCHLWHVGGVIIGIQRQFKLKGNTSKLCVIINTTLHTKKEEGKKRNKVYFRLSMENYPTSTELTICGAPIQSIDGKPSIFATVFIIKFRSVLCTMNSNSAVTMTPPGDSRHRQWIPRFGNKKSEDIL
jgi:hypothetical protein